MSSDNPVVALRRYPVKSMGGEALREVAVDARGLAGDRGYAVVDADGRFASGKDTRRFRRRDAVFAYAARTAAGSVRVVGPGGEWVVGDPALDAVLSAHMRADVAVRPESDVAHQDMGAVSLVGTATLEWCAAQWQLDADARRLRTNIVVDTSEPFVEERWVGRGVRIGGVELRCAERIPRCRMIDVDQDGATASGQWLRALARERDLCLGVYLDVETPGRITVGSAVEVC